MPNMSFEKYPPIAKESDFLYKTQAIEPGYSLSGAAYFTFPTIEIGKLLEWRDTAKYVLSYEDVYGRKYSSLAAFDNNDGIMIFPGINYTE